jgi:hypothetical protein
MSLAASSKLSATLGLRATYELDGERLHLLPRASLTYLPAQNYAVTLSAGRFSETQSSGQAVGGAAFDERMPLNVSHATHVELGVQHHNTLTFVNATAYVRAFEARPTLAERIVPGADVIAGYTTGLGTVSMAYTISRPAFGQSEYDDVQQLLALSFAGRHRGVQLDLTASYGTGVPITSIVLEHPSDLVTAGPHPVTSLSAGSFAPRAPADREHFRVDAMLGKEFRITHGQRTARLMPYVRIVNALSQRDALFYFQKGNISQPAQELARLPAVPTIGLRWDF